jgi:hypothetical protein
VGDFQKKAGTAPAGSRLHGRMRWRRRALAAAAQDMYKVRNVRQGGIVMEVAIMLAVGLAILIGIIVLVSQS